MENDNLKAIILFAIEKEQEAIDFYEQLSQKVKSKAIVDEILKIKKMEEQHKERLKKVEIPALIRENSSRVAPNLKIADYIVQATPSAEMSWQDLLNIAMHRELAAMELYAALSKKVSDSDVARLFERLSREESEHKLIFERMWDEDIMKEN